jgi:pimeloyl-ACP methyl ester carboxylesterase
VETSDGVRLAVCESGPADAPVTVVLLHGWVNDMSVWDPVVAALGPDLHVLRYDHRGHGQSEPAPRGTATIEQLGDDLAEVLTKLVPQGKVVLGGHSMGGMTMMSLAARHPGLVAERVLGAVFAATSSGKLGEVTFGLPKPLFKAMNKLDRKRRGKPKVTPEVTTEAPRKAVRQGAMAVNNKAVAAGILRWLAFGPRPDKEAVRLTLKQVAGTDRHSAGGFRRALGKHELRAALASYEGVRTLVLAGERDRLTPLEHARAIAEATPGAELVIYPRTGHMLPYERTAELAAWIRRLAV